MIESSKMRNFIAVAIFPYEIEMRSYVELCVFMLSLIA